MLCEPTRGMLPWRRYWGSDDGEKPSMGTCIVAMVG